jgi:hypothetical protein
MVEDHWWNGSYSRRGRRDVYIRSDGEKWEVMARIGGDDGAARVQECPGRSSAVILARAWRGGSPGWREIFA